MELSGGEGGGGVSWWIVVVVAVACATVGAVVAAVVVKKRLEEVARASDGTTNKAAQYHSVEQKAVGDDGIELVDLRADEEDSAEDEQEDGDDDAPLSSWYTVGRCRGCARKGARGCARLHRCRRCLIRPIFVVVCAQSDAAASTAALVDEMTATVELAHPSQSAVVEV